MITFTPEKISELLAMCSEALPEEDDPQWEFDPTNTGDVFETCIGILGSRLHAGLGRYAQHEKQAEAEAKFVVAAADPRTGYAVVLDENLRLQARVEQLTEELSQVAMNEQAAYAQGQRDEYNQTEYLRQTYGAGY